MKVMQVLPALNGGGVEKGTLEVARYLVELGHESIVLSAGGSMVPKLVQEGSRHLTLDIGRKSLFTFRHIWQLRKILRQEKLDILHLRSRMPAWVCWLAWRGLPEHARPRLVTTVHGLYSVSGYSAIMCRGERVIAVSNTVFDYIHTRYPSTDMSRIRVIYRGIEPEEFPRGYQPTELWLKQWYAQYPQLAGKIILTIPGRLTRLKGHHDFINLVAALISRGYDVKGLIVGGEDPKRREYAQELQMRVDELGLASDVIFTGVRVDIRDVYAVSDIVFSLSTQPESFGRTVAEALSLGRPVVGYDHGGVGEILKAVFPAGLVKVSDQVDLAEKVSVLLVNHPAVGEVPFLKKTMLEQTLSCYKELTNVSGTYEGGNA